MHGRVNGLEVARKALRIEERVGESVGRELFGKRAQRPRIARDRDRALFVARKIGCDQFRQADGVEQTRGDAALKARRGAGDKRNARPQRIAGCRVRVVRVGVEEEIREHNPPLKFELGEDFESMHVAKEQLFDYVEVFYNRQRRHSSIDYVSPARHERERRAELQLAA